jgi:hypothetical protein
VEAVEMDIKEEKNNALVKVKIEECAEKKVQLAE